MKLELRGITKRFGSLVANDGISIIVEPGEIHALLGENGAGKSTLMNVLFGLYHADEGEILARRRAACTSPAPARRWPPASAWCTSTSCSIPVFTVAENVMLGHEPVEVRHHRPRRGARPGRARSPKRFGFDIDPDAKVERPAGRRSAAGRDRQGALARGARCSSSTSRPRCSRRRRPTSSWRRCGSSPRRATSIVFITHKLREVKAVADRITVIRLGKVVGTADADRVDRRARRR